MTQSTTIDLGHVARDLGLPTTSVERTLELLDEGNTVPFITRYRKDLTGGLDEEQIRAIQWRVGKVRQLAERKATILKTIEAQGKLTPEIEQQIKSANTPKRLEDLYLPFKPKKQTLATIAREKGLEPLAIEIYEARPEAADLQARVTAFLSPEKELNSVEDVLTGMRHLIAERFSENAELRGRLRRIFQRSGKIVCTKVEAEPEKKEEPIAAEGDPPKTDAEPLAANTTGDGATEGQSDGANDVTALAAAAPATATSDDIEPSSEASDAPPPLPEAQTTSDAATQSEIRNPKSEIDPQTTAATSSDAAPAETLPTGRLFEAPAAAAPGPLAALDLKKKRKKKKKKVIGEHAFKDYYNFTEPLGKVPPHRVLAINRGERAHAIRVKIDADVEAMLREALEFLIAPNHPHADFLRGCVQDSLARLIVPSLERELRREMTERAEEHAVDVFVRNLRKLLLQPPTRGRRVLAIDPGFKSGSKMAALDEFGNVMGHGMVFVIGKDEERRKKARTRLADMVKQYNVSVIAIGNGTGCRETEQLVADVLADELKDRDVAYVVVNEAGASIYSTSPLGREELPQFDALQRGAISIGRRLLDPLSEMVKINPANLGVGLYQHDIKAKHLKDSLDAVVESAVNFVGVDVNSASPALLRYVSGMNALTARRVYEYRREKGPFKNRNELKEVPGFGEQTFVQAAGFLKVIGGENPLDATWIHPESYEIAGRVLEKLEVDLAELAKIVPAPLKKEEKKEFAAELTAAETREGEASAEPATKDEASEIVDQGKTEKTGEETTATVPGDDTIAQPVDQSAATEQVLSTEYSVPTTQLATDSETAGGQSQPVLEQQPDAAPVAASDGSAVRQLLSDRANALDVPRVAEDMGIGVHLLDDILMSLCRPGLDPRDSLSPPVFRRGIMKLEDLAAGMELSGTVLNVVDFGVFVDIGLSDSGLVHISRLADRFIRDPHEVVGVGDVLKVWVVDVDKNRRRVSLTAIPPGVERQQRQPRERPQRPPRGDRPPQQRPPQGQRPPRQGARPPQPATAGAAPAGERPPQTGDRPPRPRGGGRRDQGRGGRPQEYRPKTVERPPTKPKPIKPLTKAQEEGRAPMRSFSDLAQLFDKKKKKPDEDAAPPPQPE